MFSSSSRAGGRRTFPRGLAMPLVMAIVTVVFCIGFAIACLSIDQARIVRSAQEGALSRQAAFAGIAHARGILARTANWQALTGAELPSEEIQVPGSDPPTFYTMTLEGTPVTPYTARVRVQAWVKRTEDPPRYKVTMVAAFRRSTGAFRYPLQANGTVSLANTSVSSPEDVAIRTNTLSTSAVQIDNVANVTGDVMVGPTPGVGGSPAVTSHSAASAEVFMPITPPALAPAAPIQRSSQGGTP